MCGSKPGTKRLHVDHDHKWKYVKVRTTKGQDRWKAEATYNGITYVCGAKKRNDAIQDVKGYLKRASVRSLLCFRCNSFIVGFNDPALHPVLIEELNTAIPKAAQAGVPNLIAMFGNRRGRSDAEGIANCVAGLSKVAPVAEQHGVTICVELLNSKVDHHDYMCDHTAWGVEVCKRVGSERFRLLYDIYHMQIMEGDVVATIRENAACIAHYHTGGVPGRHEIDGTQELNYPAIMRAIAGTGFKGFVAQEFIPTGQPLESLAAAVKICSV